jgi:hypothetical protein
VLSLLTGKVPARDLPEMATEPGEVLDVDLREELAPRTGARARVGALATAGGLDAATARKALTDTLPRLRGCYWRGLARNPNLQGSVGLSLSVMGDGRILSAKNIGSDVPDSSVVACLLSRITRLRMPPTDAGTTTVTARLELLPR